jgi:hypothetical protein
LKNEVSLPFVRDDRIIFPGDGLIHFLQEDRGVRVGPEIIQQLL